MIIAEGFQVCVREGKAKESRWSKDAVSPMSFRYGVGRSKEARDWQVGLSQVVNDGR
jgi:hypothetical protein